MAVVERHKISTPQIDDLARAAKSLSEPRLRDFMMDVLAFEEILPSI
jgi:hypothetical protein